MKNIGDLALDSRLTPLNTSREKILKECANTDLKEAKIINSYLVKESTKMDNFFYVSTRVVVTTLIN